jgi:hypothetical protein
MSYLGRDVDKISNIETLDNITFDGSQSYTLQKGGSNFTPSSAAAILISIDGVVQSGNFTCSGSTIDFGTAVAGTSTCNFIIHLGVGLITAPADNAVVTAKIADDAVTIAKLNLISTGSAPSLEAKGDGSSQDGYIQLNCSQNSHGIKLKSPPHSANASYTLTFPNNDGDANQFLQTDGSGVLSFAAAGGGQYNLVTRTAITSNVASVAFTNLEANTYHKFILQGIDSTDNGGEDLSCRVSTDNGSSFVNSNYRFSYFQFYDSGSTNTTGSGGGSSTADKWRFADGFHSSGADEGLHGEFTLFNVGNGQRPFFTAQTSHKADSTNRSRSTVAGGFVESGLTINGVQFFFDSGNITGSSYAFITHYKGVIA